MFSICSFGMGFLILLEPGVHSLRRWCPASSSEPVEVVSTKLESGQHGYMARGGVPLHLLLLYWPAGSMCPKWQLDVMEDPSTFVMFSKGQSSYGLATL